MSSWFRMETTFADHHKVKLLARLLGCSVVEARGYVTGLWCRVCGTAPDGDLSNYSPVAVAVMADWEGDPERFFGALIDVGLVDVDGDRAELHEWMTRAQSYREANRARQRRNASATRTRHTADGSATVVATDGQDRQENKKPPPARAREGESPMEEISRRWSELGFEPLRWPDMHMHLWTQRELEIRDEAGLSPADVLDDFFAGAERASAFIREKQFSLKYFLSRRSAFWGLVNQEWNERERGPPQTAGDRQIDAVRRWAEEVEAEHEQSGGGEVDGGAVGVFPAPGG